MKIEQLEKEIAEQRKKYGNLEVNFRNIEFSKSEENKMLSIEYE